MTVRKETSTQDSLPHLRSDFDLLLESALESKWARIKLISLTAPSGMIMSRSHYCWLELYEKHGRGGYKYFSYCEKQKDMKKEMVRFFASINHVQ